MLHFLFSSKFCLHSLHTPKNGTRITPACLPAFLQQAGVLKNLSCREVCTFLHLNSIKWNYKNDL